MKITIDIDCTPEEARTFLGLPDVKPFQDAMLEEMQTQAAATMQSMTPEALMNTFFPSGIPGIEEMQRMFWNMATGNTDSSNKKK